MDEKSPSQKEYSPSAYRQPVMLRLHFPYLQYLRHALPATTKLDLLTRKECADVPKNIYLFDKSDLDQGRKEFQKTIAAHLSPFAKAFDRGVMM
jgi:hypothetical protein